MRALPFGLALLLIGTPGPGDPAPGAVCTWVQIFPATTPPPRHHAAMAYDARRGVTVLYGGMDAATGVVFGDTWEWDGSDWTERTGVGSPPPRHGAAMEYDSRRQKMVMFGGGSGTTAQETWEYDGSNWAKRTVQGGPPGRRNVMSMAFDSQRGQMLLTQGDLLRSLDEYKTLWLWDGSTWSDVGIPAGGPSARSRHRVIYDSSRDHFLLAFGRNDEEGMNGSNNGETWRLEKVDGAWIWTLVHEDAALARSRHVMAYDSHRSVVVAFSGMGARSQTIQWTGSAWGALDLAVEPASRWYASMAYDSARRRMVLHGGTRGNSSERIPPLSDTWELSCSWETAVERRGDGVPTAYGLSQNYPNPFNPQTQIAFAIPEAGAVSLVVYDVLGREVATLAEGTFAAGRYEAAWDAVGVPSGVYVYRLKAGAFAEARTLVVQK